MTERQAGLSAISMAYMRAYHATHDSPKIFDDFAAASLFTPEELAQTDQQWAVLLQYTESALAATNPDPATALAWVVQGQAAITLGRSRYTEDRLEEAIQNGVRQYVNLGAGLDTFAYRRRDLEDRLQVFEVDHPATQALKRQRVASQHTEQPINLHYIPVDFTQESLADVLKNSAYDPKQLSFFSWLGVSFYLTHTVVFETLQTIASIASPGSTLVFDYMDEDAFIPEKTARRVQLMQTMAKHLGEPMKAGFDPTKLASDLARVGLRPEENLSPAAIEARYFQGRADRYHAIEHIHFAKAVVI